MSLDKIIFGKKRFADLLEEIYNNQKKKTKQINTLIAELRPLIESIGDATLIVPLIATYLEVDVKNDEALIKIAGIIQRIFQNNSSSSDSNSPFNITPEEQAQLQEEIDKIKTKKS